jgi:hypothetical protein
MGKEQKREKSAACLKKVVDKKVRGVFAKALTCIEIKFGKNFEGYAAIRAEILRAGNDAIREIGNFIDERFIVEMLPDVVTIKFKGQGGQDGKASE